MFEPSDSCSGSWLWVISPCRHPVNRVWKTWTSHQGCVAILWDHELGASCIHAFTPKQVPRSQPAQAGMGRSQPSPSYHSQCSLHSLHRGLYLEIPLVWLEGHLGARHPGNVAEAPTEGSSSPANTVPWSPQENWCQHGRPEEGCGSLAAPDYGSLRDQGLAFFSIALLFSLGQLFKGLNWLFSAGMAWGFWATQVKKPTAAAHPCTHVFGAALLLGNAEHKLLFLLTWCACWDWGIAFPMERVVWPHLQTEPGVY